MMRLWTGSMGWLVAGILAGAPALASVWPNEEQTMEQNQQGPSLKEQLAQKRDRRRVMVLYSREANGSDLVTQQRRFGEQNDQLTERQLDVIILTDTNLSAADRNYLAQQLKLAPSAAFQGWLIGKDGGVKHTFKKPVSLKELTGIIDQMPMRQSEMRRSN